MLVEDGLIDHPACRVFELLRCQDFLDGWMVAGSDKMPPMTDCSAESARRSVTVSARIADVVGAVLAVAQNIRGCPMLSPPC